jgi:hypothetical protein
VPATSFKSDVSFLEKLALGATATRATINRLKALGFEPIELERGSTGYKIWKKIKIKRVRVPDILCLKSGQRFESRGKTKLEISMSHSQKDPYRAWDVGMRPDDQVAIVLCKQRDDSPISWETISPVHFIKISDMQDAVAKRHIQISKPKGVEEGSEIRMIWPCAHAHAQAVVTEIGEKNIKLQADAGGKIQRCSLSRKNSFLQPQCKVGDLVQANQIVAAVVPIDLNPIRQVEVEEEFFITQLQSASLSERYAAAKALRFRGYKKAGVHLEERMLDKAEDIYAQLEAAAALAAYANPSGWAFLSGCLNSEYLTVQLETIIVLSEIADPQSEQLLIRVLMDANRNAEVRAGAAWALGEFATKHSAAALIDAFNLTNTEIKIEAARALLKITPSQIDQIVAMMKAGHPAKREGIAWALARAGGFNVNDLLDNSSDDNLRRWVSYILGYGKPRFLEAQIEELARLDPEVHFAASVLWQLLASWIYELKEY